MKTYKTFYSYSHVLNGALVNGNGQAILGRPFRDIADTDAITVALQSQGLKGVCVLYWQLFSVDEA